MNKQKTVSWIIIISLLLAIGFTRQYISEVRQWQEANGVGFTDMYVMENIGIGFVILAGILTFILHKMQNNLFFAGLRFKKNYNKLDERLKGVFARSFARAYHSLVGVALLLMFTWDSQGVFQFFWVAVFAFFAAPAIFASWDKQA